MKIVQNQSHATTTDDGTKSSSSGSEGISDMLDSITITSASTGDVEVVFTNQSGDDTGNEEQTIVSLPVIMPSNSRTGNEQRRHYGLSERYKRWYEKWRERKELEAEDSKEGCYHENEPSVSKERPSHTIKSSHTMTTKAIMKSSSTLKVGIVKNASSESRRRRRRKSNKKRGAENNKQLRSKSKNNKDLQLHRLVEDTKGELKSCKTIFDTAFSAAVSKQLEILSSRDKTQDEQNNIVVPLVNHDISLDHINASLREKCQNLEQERQSLSEKMKWDQKLIQDLQQEIKTTKNTLERYKNESDQDRHLLSLTVRHLKADISSREIHICQIEKENSQLKQKLEALNLKIKHQNNNSTVVRKNDPETASIVTATAISSINHKPPPSIVSILEEELIATKTEIASAKRSFRDYVKKTEERRQNMKTARRNDIVTTTTPGEEYHRQHDNNKDDNETKEERRRLEDDSLNYTGATTVTTTSSSSSASSLSTMGHQSVRFEHLQRELDAFKAFADSIIVDKSDYDFKQSQ